MTFDDISEMIGGWERLAVAHQQFAANAKRDSERTVHLQQVDRLQRLAHQTRTLMLDTIVPYTRRTVAVAKAKRGPKSKK